jgi:hypothetical protein
MVARPLRSGWYADPRGPGTLRYWDGERWTERRVPSPLALPPPPDPPAGWYADPWDPDRLRYWDGDAWTDHRRPAPTSTPPPPPPPTGWYPDPDDRGQLRYWEGGRWTDHRWAIDLGTPTGPVGIVPTDGGPAEPPPRGPSEPPASDSVPPPDATARRRHAPEALSELTDIARPAEGSSPERPRRSTAAVPPRRPAPSPESPSEPRPGSSASASPEPSPAPTSTAGAAPRRARRELPHRRQRVAAAGPWLSVLLALFAGLAAVGVLTGVVALVLNRDYFAGTRSGATSFAADERLVAVSLLLLGLHLIVAVVWLAWLRRAHVLVAGDHPDEVRYVPAGAVAAWLVPGLSRIRARAAGDHRPRSRLEDAGADVARLVRAWWASWLAALAVGVVADRLLYPADDRLEVMSAWERYYLVTMAAFVLAAVSAVLAQRAVARLRPRIPDPDEPGGRLKDPGARA